METIVALCPASVVSIWSDCSLSFSACCWLMRFWRCSAAGDVAIELLRLTRGVSALICFWRSSMVGESAATAAV